MNAQFISESVEVTNIYDTARNFWLQVGNIIDIDTILWGIEVRESRTKLMTGRAFCRMDCAERAERLISELNKAMFTGDLDSVKGAGQDYKPRANYPEKSCNPSQVGGHHDYNFGVRCTRSLKEVPLMLQDIDSGKLNMDPEGLAFKCGFCLEGGHSATYRDKSICCPALKATCDKLKGDYVCTRHDGGCGAVNSHHRDYCLANPAGAEFRITSMGHYNDAADGSAGQYQAPAWYMMGRGL